MGRRRMSRSCLIALGALALATGCSSDSAHCVSNGVGEVCADNSTGSIVFHGSGLAADSEVVIHHDELGPAIYVVGSAGTFEPGGRGVMSVFEGTEFTFTVFAVDRDGQPIEEELTIST